MVGSPPPKVVLPMRRNTPVSWRSVGAGTLFLERDAEGLHLAVEMAALQAQHFGGAGYVAFGFFELLQNVIALGGLTDVLQAAEALHGAVKDGATGAVEWNVARVDAGLRIHDDDALHQIAQLAHIAGPGIFLERAERV